MLRKVMQSSIRNPHTLDCDVRRIGDEVLLLSDIINGVGTVLGPSRSRRGTGGMSDDDSTRTICSRGRSHHSSVMLRLKRRSGELQRLRASAQLGKHLAAKGEAFEGNEALSRSFSQEKTEDAAEDGN